MPEYIKSGRRVHHARRPRKIKMRDQRIRDEMAAKHQALLDELAVEAKIKMGLYESKPHFLPHGVDIWERECQGDYEIIKIPTVAVCFPVIKNPSWQLRNLNPAQWANHVYYWAFKQTDWSVINWCILDLLDRLIDLPDWSPVEKIPLHWQYRPWEKRDQLWQAVERINQNKWTGQYIKPHPKQFLSLDANRHERTPYDYEWQTNRRSRDEAKEFWNKAIEESLNNGKK